MKPTARQALYTLINSVNETSFSVANTVLSAPMENHDEAHSNKNTKVIMSGIVEEGLRGSVTFWYNRLDIRDFAGSSTVELVWAGETTISDFIPKFNEEFGINLTVDDIIDSGLPNPDEQTTTFDVVMNSDSYAYYGQFTLKITKTPEDVGEGFNSGDLDGLGQGDV